MQEAVETVCRGEALLERLVGSDCTFCGTGRFDLEMYKGNEAVVCTECGVPGAQIW